MLFLKKSQCGVAVALCIIAISSVGCTNKQPAGNAEPKAFSVGQTATMLVANNAAYHNVPVFKEKNGLVWIPLRESARSLGLDVHKAKDSLAIGNTDAAYTVKVNRKLAYAGDQPIELPHAPKVIAGRPYMTTQAFSVLLGTSVKWDAQHSEINIAPIDDGFLPKRQSASGPEQSGPGSGRLRSLSVPTADKHNLIQFAETFIGTPYQFSAGNYEAARTFDCSSFVQYVYAHYGVNLPRTSRSQAEVGQTVSADQLQPGDLMFFYTPGRYDSNRIVGHVGIYEGDGKIIHTYGEPGVTISEFNDYWRGRFLFGKRVN
ncbi:C40 family peptidase [Paenibacillus abyssi]|uniref:NlpC/P60 domain-containing protein n=1 Tax=Paenibacillus abyssi TaxID=1340531 RepID=A0A917CQX1_9BACL|nr:NlpC/P60 family protein [Paenibacillus abyssi]GGF95890.1 hypothetical protein GCM10010916_11510 [Paenibacillus abyssi]